MDRQKMKIPAGVQKGIDRSPMIIGVGPSAWPRIITSYYFPKFKTICLNDCQDNKIIENSGRDIFSLKKNNPLIDVSPQTPGRIIETQLVKKYISEIKEPFAFLVYKSSSYLEKVCKENGWKFIGNTKAQMDIYENKKIFKEILPKVGITPIPGENIKIEELTDEKFCFYQKKLGVKKLVLQLAEMTYGGGSGTFFADKVSDLIPLREKVIGIRKTLEGKKKKIETVNIAPYITGDSASISCCATKFGTLTGPIQTQIIDVPNTAPYEEGRSGRYCGTDWNYRHYSNDSQKQADEIAQKFGEYMYENGYKGIFGLDLIVEENGKVWPVECNPRDTDAFPMVSMQMMEAGAVPIDVFHNLEHLEVDYEINFEETNSAYKSKLYEYSQIIIENRLKESAYVRGKITAGVYDISNDKFEYVKPGFSIFDLDNEDQILITENVPNDFKDRGYSSSARLFRVIKKGGMIKEYGVLTDKFAKVVEKIYEALKLTPVPEGLINENGLKVFYANRFTKDLLDDENYKVADIVNIVGKGSKNTRLSKISWRKTIEAKSRILDQIPSKRTKKHINSDLNKMQGLDLSILIIDSLGEPDFLEWLSLYEKIISSKKGGEVLIDANWLKNKQQKGKKVSAILSFQNKKLVGGELFFEVNGILGISYGVAERIEGLSGGLTLLMDYKFLEYAQSKGYKEVSFGQDTNLYGGNLSVGLADYKERLGFKPVPANKAYFVQTIVNNIEKFPNGVVYYAGDSTELTRIESKI